MWTVAGVALLAVNGWLDGDAWSDWKAALVLIGGVALGIGVGMILARTFGPGRVPYSVRSGKYLRYTELYFPKQRMREVVRLCAAGISAPCEAWSKAPFRRSSWRCMPPTMTG